MSPLRRNGDMCDKVVIYHPVSIGGRVFLFVDRLTSDRTGSRFVTGRTAMHLSIGVE